MEFNQLVLTNQGASLIAKALNGATLQFTKLKLGNGTVPDGQTEAALKELCNPLLEIPITAIEKGDTYIEVSGIFDNNSVDSGFYQREIGLYAQDPDEGEILYAYANAGDKCDFLPRYDGKNFLKTTIQLSVVVGGAEDVTAIIGEYSGYASEEAFKAHLLDTDNPHRVTANDVGLGNVPNVTTNDQTPSYSRATSVAKLVSGEKLSIAFGKIAKAIDGFLAHLDGKNPHNLDANAVGAASKTHTHAATDITNGVLGVKRGGTGADSVDGILAALGLDKGIIQEAYLPNSYTPGAGCVKWTNGLMIQWVKIEDFMVGANATASQLSTPYPYYNYAIAPFVIGKVSTSNPKRYTLSIANATKTGYDMYVSNDSNSQGAPNIWCLSIGTWK